VGSLPSWHSERLLTSSIPLHSQIGKGGIPSHCTLSLATKQMVFIKTKATHCVMSPDFLIPFQAHKRHYIVCTTSSIDWSVLSCNVEQRHSMTLSNEQVTGIPIPKPETSCIQLYCKEFCCCESVQLCRSAAK
jgi:hypothetical protein